MTQVHVFICDGKNFTEEFCFKKATKFIATSVDCLFLWSCGATTTDSVHFQINSVVQLQLFDCACIHIFDLPVSDVTEFKTGNNE